MLKGKIAIVTGAAGGMGVAHVRALAEAGAAVVAVDIDATGATAVAEQVGRDTIAARLDVTNPSSWAAVVTLAEERFGPVTTLVNNAGVLARGSVTELDPADWERVLAVNLTGCYLGMRAAIPSMLRAGGGSIVSIASVSGIAGGLRYAAYNASKGGLITLTKGVALDYAEHGIRANTICPGSVETPMNAMTPKSFVLDATPLGRRGHPDEIAACVVFLASEASSYITGHDLVADGGYLAW
jgi:3alpha(or 20beta)-hydroxysteroid dehydrogenase